MVDNLEEAKTYESSNDDIVANQLMLDLARRAYQADKSNVIIYELDSSECLADILLNTGGYIYDQEHDKLFRRKDPSLNSKGLLRFKELLHGYVNKITVLTNFKKNEIIIQHKEFLIDLIIEFMEMREDYGIQLAMFSSTIDMIDNLVYANLKRAYEKGTLQHLEAVLSIQGRLQENTQEHKKSIFET